mgnify:CR=1 FL=1
MVEMQEIMKKYGKGYRENHKMMGYKLKTMEAIEKCRTAELGAHEDVCDNCGYKKISYNSCRNRHCPKCQSVAREKWIYNREYDLLKVKYFHVVMTIPEELYMIAYQNQTKVYNILFKAVGETLEELGKDKKYLGAQIGFMEVLHTWGQTLVYHPHIHAIVPAGGIDKERKWRNSKKKFFIPVKVLSRKFRGKFLYYLKQEKLEFYGENKYLEIKENFDKLMAKLYNKEWVSYCKPPFKDAKKVIKYLGRYTHRVAIANSRIIKEENGEVTFKYRDYKDNKEEKEMTLKAEEFIRRFMMHILPPRFMKIRHYGLLGNRNKKTKLAECKKLTKTANLEKLEISTLEILKKTLGVNFNLCPICKKGHLLSPNSG